MELIVRPDTARLQLQTRLRWASPAPNFRTWIFPTCVFHGGSQRPLQLWLVALQCGTLARGSLSGTSPRDLSPGDLSQAIAFCGDDFTPCSHPALPAADVNFLECPGRMEIKKIQTVFCPQNTTPSTDTQHLVNLTPNHFESTCSIPVILPLAGFPRRLCTHGCPCTLQTQNCTTRQRQTLRITPSNGTQRMTDLRVPRG